MLSVSQRTAQQAAPECHPAVGDLREKFVIPNADIPKMIQQSLLFGLNYRTRDFDSISQKYFRIIYSSTIYNRFEPIHKSVTRFPKIA